MKETVLTSTILILAILIVRQLFQNKVSRKLIYGIWLLVVLRLIPAVPYNLINYAFGLTEMKLSTYLVFSAIGLVPGTLAFINIGDKALDPTSPDFWIAIGLLIMLLAITALLGKKLFPKEKEYE